MQRREFVTLLGAAAAVGPLPARAQQSGRMRRIGVLLGNAERDPQAVAGLAAFKTAKALGIDIPATLLGRADEVIE